MTFNPKGSPAQIAWSVFGGLDTELAPPTQPEGLSPDCQDVAFIPGSVFTRPGLSRIFSAALFGTSSVNYNKTFIQPNLAPLNLYLTGDGVMRVQDPINSPTITNTIFTTVIGSYASSVTSFGREYIATHDGKNALDIPRQYDPSLTGNNGWRRITQDGPAGTITASDAATTTIPIVTAPPTDGIVPVGSAQSITATSNASSVATITTANPHGLSVGDIVVIYGVTPFQYNGTFNVTTVPTPSSFTYAFTGVGVGPGTGFGTAVPVKVTVTTTINHGLIAGETITISGDSNNAYNNNQNQGGNISLLSGGKCTFYGYSHSTGGGWPGQGTALPPPGPVFNLANNHSIMFNPVLDDGTVLLPGLPSSPSLEDVSPMNIYGVNATGSWDGTNVAISPGATENWSMVVEFNIGFPAAGSYTLRMVHDDAAIIGMGGGITYVSGPLLDKYAPVHTQSIKDGYPVMAMGNASGDFAPGGAPYRDVFVVSVPAAGVYPVEIDYINWETDQVLTLQFSTDGGSTWKTIQPGGVAFATPPTWTVLTVTGTKTFTFNSVFANGVGEGGTIIVGGLTAPGNHQVCVSFLTDTGFITKPSPPVPWVAAGNKRVVVGSLPIGPPNVVARIVSFTGSGGGNFFYIPVPALDPTTGATVATSTVVNDNTSTSATFDFSDNTLFAAIAIDITGNNLFNLVTLGPCAGVFAYSNRIIVWGDTNKINNLLNMGFEANANAPDGWDTSQNNGGGALASVGDYYLGWQITGNGLAVKQGQLQQNAFQDYKHVAILAPNTQYTFKCWAWAQSFNMTGSIIADLFSPSSGVLATATIPANTLGVGQANATFVQANFNTLTPATIPSDTLLRIYGLSLNNGLSITVDEMMLVFTSQPIVPGQARVSYALNPESFDSVTGLYSVEYSEAIMGQKIIRDNLYTLTVGHLARTTDNGSGEPITWTNYTVSDIIGGMSQRCFDVAEGFGMFGAESGLYMFAGGEPEKVSQEIQTLWSAIDSNLRKHVWVKNDPINRRVYVGIPLNSYSPTGVTFSPLSCNKMLVLDYRNLNTAGAIQGSGPVKLGFSGKLLSTDFARKWTIWNISANAGDILSVAGDNQPQIVFGGGNGQGTTGGQGNSYSLLDNKGFDDDYGIIGASNGEGITRADGTFRPTQAYYVTYFAPSHEQEQIFQTGSARKLFTYLEGYISGVGYVYIVPLIDRLGKGSTRPPKSRLLSLTPGFDLDWPLNIQANRMALLIYAKATVT